MPVRGPLLRKLVIAEQVRATIVLAGRTVPSAGLELRQAGAAPEVANEAGRQDDDRKRHVEEKDCHEREGETTLYDASRAARKGARR